MNSKIAFLALALVLIVPACKKTQVVRETPSTRERQEYAKNEIMDAPVLLANNDKEGFDDFPCEETLHRHVTQHELHMMQEQEAIEGEYEQRHRHHPGHTTQRERQLEDEMGESFGPENETFKEELLGEEVGS